MMKVNRLKQKTLTLGVVFFLLITSCTKKDIIPDYSYFVSKELAVSYKKDYITSLINIVAGSIPEVSNLTTKIASDINVYSVVYKTTVDGKQIEASGLVCVPVTPGNYPVLSFQNGTNTVNAYAPTRFAIDYSYQMIEIIASMGYIVVIADYPGFGESSQIPHPYLVKEPTVQSLVDLLYTVKELAISELPDITIKNEYYLLGYSQGGWATLALHKALEIDYSNDFNLKGSVCGAGPYNITLLMQGMLEATNYPMPVYLGYIVNAYSYYKQFTNPVSEIFNEPYASRLNTLYTGSLTFDQINSQLTTSVKDLLNPDFLSGFTASTKYSTVRNALINNSISAWHSYKPLLLIHGGSDTSVNPITTENMYNAMIQAGTSGDICTKIILPGLDHGEGLVPSMIKGIVFLTDLNTSK
jgi:pimeloyl-ACP methyl ester carboxylesterase